MVPLVINPIYTLLMNEQLELRSSRLLSVFRVFFWLSFFPLGSSNGRKLRSPEDDTEPFIREAAAVALHAAVG